MKNFEIFPQPNGSTRVVFHTATFYLGNVRGNDSVNRLDDSRFVGYFKSGKLRVLDAVEQLLTKALKFVYALRTKGLS